jgi:hypothetical protein
MASHLELLEADFALRQSQLAKRNSVMNNDSWLNGKGFNGPLGTDVEIKDFASSITRERFTPYNVFRKAAIRHRDNVLREEIAWGYNVDRFLREDEKPNENEQRLIDELEAVVTRFYDDSNVLLEIQEATLALAWSLLNPIAGLHNTETYAKPLYSSAPMRFSIPAKFVRNGSIKKVEASKALKYLRFKQLSPLQAGTVKDDYDETLFSYYRYSVMSDSLPVAETEISILGENVDDDLRGQLSGLGYKPTDTLVIILDNESKVKSAAAYPLEGNLTIYDMQRTPVLPEDALGLQVAINSTNTVMMVNMFQGLLERMVGNAQLPGHWEKDGAKVTAGTPNAVFVADKMTVGGGATNFLVGVPYYHENGKVAGYKDINYQRLGPEDISPIRDTLHEFLEQFYDVSSQSHALMGSDATATGKSRIEAKDDFKGSLTQTIKAVEGGGRWFLDTTRCFINFIEGKNRFVGLRPFVKVNVRLETVSSEDKKVSILAKEKGIISHDTTLSELGIDDTDAEKAKLEIENGEAVATEPELEPEAEVEAETET